MFLRDKNEFIRNFVPLTIAINSFKYGGQRHEIPFIVGNQLLHSIESYIKDEYIEFKDTRILGPSPYPGDDVSLFIGLFRVQVDNLARQLFSFMDNIIGIFNLSSLIPYLDVADKLGDALAGLMSLQEIEMRFGMLNTFSHVEGSHNFFRSGYLVFVGCPENEIMADQLWIQNGRLKWC